MRSNSTLFFQLLSDEQLHSLLHGASNLQILLIPALGGLIIGPIIYLWAREAKGHGVPEVMESVAFRGGVIRKRLVLIKALASGICIASGGSVGREGPIAQIGASWGSTVGQFFKVKKESLTIMVGCGVAAGIAATFNAPIAGAFFAMEVILGNFKIKTITPIVISSVIATVISRLYLGNSASFIVPVYSMVSTYEIPLYMILGAVSAVVGWIFITMLYRSEDFFDKIRWIPEYLKPCLGGAFIGLIGLFCVEVYGVGYSSINLALKGDLAFQVLLLLLVMKCSATCITLGSGGSGGVFAPSLFLGAMTGGILGHFFHYLFPKTTATPGAYSLVGMGCVVAATTHAPISAIIILFEMTQDYKIILPLMLGCVVSVTLIRYLKRESIYTMKLMRRGVNLEQDAEGKILQSIPIRQVMHTNYEIVPENMSLEELIRLIVKSGHITFPVVSSDSRFYGLISLRDFQDYVSMDYVRKFVIAKEIADPHFISLTPEHNLLDALQILGTKDVEQIPVVSGNNPSQIRGMVSREILLKTYYRAILEMNFEARLNEEDKQKIKTVNEIAHNDVYFTKEFIIEKLQGSTKEDVIHELLLLIQRNGPKITYDIEKIEEKILARESLASTVGENGFAMPHARLEKLDGIVAAFGHSEQGINFGINNVPVHSIALFLSPLDNPKIHLNFVCYIAEILKKEEMVESLNSACERSAILNILCRRS